MIAPCSHAITVEDRCLTTEDVWRSCVLCGALYNRTRVLRRLERAIRDRYALPRSPWSASERADEAIW